MGYLASDLGVLSIIRDPKRLEGTSYFELHPGEPPEPYACWLPGSVFVRDAGFDFFVECFEKANPAFDYFAFERFDSAQQRVLVEQLDQFIEQLQPGCARGAVFGRYSSLFKQDIWDAVNTEALREAVRQAAQELREFVAETQTKLKPLWVMGM
jgi:hypothetical protein